MNAIELAADVRGGFARVEKGTIIVPDVTAAAAALDALVARVTDLEAQRDSVVREMRDSRAEAAEAALATTRQALTEIADAEWSSLHANEELANVQEFARRALAATEEHA